VFVATAIAVWQLDSDSNGKDTATPTVIPTTPVGVKAQIVTPTALHSIARALGQSVYWAGERAGTRIEYTQASDGSTYVRYLTGSARAGDGGSNYVVVATYEQPDAFARVQSIARKKHFTVEHLPNGAVAVTEPKTPRNVHIVFPGQRYQVEVYAPNAEEAHRIVRSGAVTPVG
jgi:hypothetical protein